VKMWGGRFSGEPDAAFMEFSSSIVFDVRLYPYDIECTRAWAQALSEAGVIDSDELKDIEDALRTVLAEMDGGTFAVQAADEDVHTAVERRLVEIAGKAAGKVRTGRSRNDQVATDLRLFAMDACADLIALMKRLQATLLDAAERTVDLIVPGHTHLQQAQPVLLAHVLLAFFEMLGRDAERLGGAMASSDCLVLGSGALAGTTVHVDRDDLAERLGFSRISANSMDAVSDRDFACDLVYALAMTMVHLSRMAEQVILWTSSEWGLARLHDAWATGSSLMPQKKNPDAAELVRGKSGRVVGSLMGMMMVLKGLPLAYNRDLQEDKESLFDAVDTAAGCIAAMDGTFATLEFDRERAADLAGGGYMTATDLADFLASKGVEFPEAHRIVGEVVAHCIGQGQQLDELTVDELARFSDLLTEEALTWLTPEASVARRSCAGGTSRASVEARIEQARASLAC
jgi:argininosuccinate lyase